MYENLKMVLDELFRELYFPVGGSSDSAELIWMDEGHGRKLVTVCTPAGYVTVLPQGGSINYMDIDQVKNLYVSFFTSGNSLQFMRNMLAS